jgi:hypothetical protein
VDETKLASSDAAAVASVEAAEAAIDRNSTVVASLA